MIESAPSAVGDGLALTETIVAPLGSHRVTFGRDPGDSFAVTVDRLKPDAADLRKDDLLDLLPRGSRWNPAVGWRSFIALPFDLPNVCAAAVGVEGVVPHPSRGAFPVMRAFLTHAADVSPALRGLAVSLSARGGGPLAELSEQRRLIWSSDARSPAEHQRHEVLMLNAAAAAWRRGEPRLLRTALLSEDEAPWPRAWADKLRDATNADKGGSYLVATLPAIRASFSRSTRLALLCKELLE